MDTSIDSPHVDHSSPDTETVDEVRGEMFRQPYVVLGVLLVQHVPPRDTYLLDCTQEATRQHRTSIICLTLRRPTSSIARRDSHAKQGVLRQAPVSRASNHSHYCSMMANDSTYCRKARFLPLVLLLVPGACEPSHNSSIEVQWAAVFETPIDWCTLTFAKANGSYAKHHVDIVLLSAEEGTEASLLHELDVVHESFDDCVH
eukprot:5035974-Pleurochrysis_carterae.AAC.1